MNILIVDDEKMQRSMLEGFFTKLDYSVHTAGSGQEALQIFAEKSIDLVLLDHRMDDMNGDEVLARMKSTNPLVRAIMITAYGAVDTAVKVMRLGADDFLEKPVDLEILLDKVREIEEEIVVAEEAQNVNDTIDTEQLPIKIIGESKPMQNVLSMVQRSAPTPWTVLIYGETGTGKELIGRLIHGLSPRKNGPFIELNCAAVPETLFESELFGHEKGAFTGASSRRKGLIEQAHGGTLFLDEVGEIPMTMQPKLLRALQEKAIVRVGGTEKIHIDIRVVAATNRNLKKMVEEGRFREDLYFRLNVIEIEIPPLRSRKEDIPLLLDFFLSRFSDKKITLASSALSQLMKYSFPGNVRELEHLIQRMITMSRSNTIAQSDLPDEIRRYQGEADQGTLTERLAEFEKQMIVDALEQSDWLQTRAAEILGISERVLRYKMGKAGISKKQ